MPWLGTRCDTPRVPTTPALICLYRHAAQANYSMPARSPLALPTRPPSAPQALRQLASLTPALQGLALHCRESLAGRYGPTCMVSLPSLTPLAPLGATLRTLVLSGVCLGESCHPGLGPEVFRSVSRRAAGLPPRLGLEALTGLRALVLHRVRGRMHWLLPQLQVRVEALKRLYRMSMPPTRRPCFGSDRRWATL